MDIKTVKANSRKLSVTYTHETYQKIDSFISDEAAEELAKILQQEIDHMVIKSVLDQLGWYVVVVKNKNHITTEWCDQFIKGKYRCFGHYWYFEDQRDYNYFLLKWASE